MSQKLSATPAPRSGRVEQKLGLPASPHPALLALVHLLARRAAEELTRASTLMTKELRCPIQSIPKTTGSSRFQKLPTDCRSVSAPCAASSPRKRSKPCALAARSGSSRPRLMTYDSSCWRMTNMAKTIENLKPREKVSSQFVYCL